MLGTITDPGGATHSMVSLAFYDGTLYGTKNIANEAVYIIDTTTRIATVYIDYEDTDFDFGSLAADPNTGVLYATNDDTTPFSSGLFRINLDGSATLIAPYPAGETDNDGQAVSHDGYAYLITDEPGFIYVYDLNAGAYTTPFNNLWTSAEVFSGGTWIWEPQGQLFCNTNSITIPSSRTVTAFIPLDAGEYDLKITTLGGAVTLIDPLPVTFVEGAIVTAFATGEGSNQSLGVFAWPVDVEGFFLPLYVEPEGFNVYLPIILKNFTP